MDWTNQTKEMMNQWTEMQKKMWEPFFANMPDGQKLSGEKQWEQTLAAGQQALKNTLAAQTEWLKNWVEYLKGMESVPLQVIESAEQMQEMSGRWEETQEKLWENWFEMLKGFDMSKMSSNWSEASQNPYQAWQESTKKIIDAQANLMSSWLKAYGGEQQDPE